MSEMAGGWMTYEWPVREATEWLIKLEAMPLDELLRKAAARRDEAFGRVVTYSRKVFIPLTRLCRDTCHYCTFATTPRRASSAYLSPEEVLAIARAGEAAGCQEALFTLGDKPELRYPAARRALADLGFGSTLDYLAAICERVVTETGLLPHVNAGVMDEDAIGALRRVSVSQGIMLENASSRLCQPGGPHHGSPDKHPSVRLDMIAAAGRQRVPFTSGILIGIGETRLERILSLLVLRDLHARHGHLQEVIVQNFRGKPGTRMARHPEPTLADLQWTTAAARLILDDSVSIQVPPNLSHGDYPHLLRAGINDWGGISPVTVDHVNPEAPWPHIPMLERNTAAAGHSLVPRLAVYPSYARDSQTWQHREMARRVLAASDAEGFARASSWAVGLAQEPPLAPPPIASHAPRFPARLDAILTNAIRGERLAEADVVALFSARDGAVQDICTAADTLRKTVSGEIVRYVVNRNINYTNVCSYRCQFCAFSKGRIGDTLRGPAYDISHDEIARRVTEARARGATEVCMQGGINPRYTGETYLAVVRAAKAAVADIHVHAFSPLEIVQGASTLGLPVSLYLERLQRAGLGSLPGTAAEILDDDIRAVICPDKLSTQEWIDVVETAHRVGLRTTSTIMFGHIEGPQSWARHLLHLRDLQARTGGITEFVPLPFVHMEAPLYLKGQARKGPTWRECVLMHAVARLVLHPLIPNVQASWVKLSPRGAAHMLGAGANDMGGTLMNESISRAAGTQHGQELPPNAMEQVIRSAGRIPEQRTTLYQSVPADVVRMSFGCAPLLEPTFTPFAAKTGANMNGANTAGVTVAAERPTAMVK